MPTLTRRHDPDRPDRWPVNYGDVPVGTMARCIGNPGAVESWQWFCGFYPGSNAGEQRSGTEETFDQARTAFDQPWRRYHPKRTEADFQGLARSTSLDRGKVPTL